MPLTFVAHEGGALLGKRGVAGALPDDRLGGLAHLAKDTVGGGRVEGGQALQIGAHDLVGDGRTQEADCRADPGIGRDQHAIDAELLGDACGMQRRGAAEGDKCAGTDILAAFDGVDARGVRHVLVDHLADAGGGELDGEIEFLADRRRDRRRGSWRVERQLAAGKLGGVDAAKPQTNRVFEVARIYRFKKGSGLPLRIPVIEMVEIGAGGGSIARVDRLKRITVGPDSAGADPGPACYGRGGVGATVTDADLLLGRIDPTGFSGGRMALDRGAAEAAIASEVGGPLDLALSLAAFGISEIVDENMANAARVHAIESGKDARGRTLVAFGGAAPLHAARMADKLGLDRVLVPSNAGVGSAVGFLRAPIAYEIVRSQLQRLDAFDADAANALLAAMRAEAEAIVRRGEKQAPLSETRSAFMRYRGQGHEIAVPVPARLYHAEDAAELLAAFEAAYRRLYSRVIPGVEVEVLSWVVLLSGPAPHQDDAAPALPAPSHPAPARRRAVFDPDSADFIDVAIHERNALSPGAIIPGPAIIVEDETSTVISRLFDARIDAWGYIELTRR